MEKAVIDQLMFELNRDRIMVGSKGIKKIYQYEKYINKFSKNLIQVSEAVTDLVQYTEGHQLKDHLGIALHTNNSVKL